MYSSDTLEITVPVTTASLIAAVSSCTITFLLHLWFLKFILPYPVSYYLTLFSARRCGHPGDIPHGQREGSIFVYPLHVTYKCSEGYELVGRDHRKCQDNGQWSGSLPVCLRKCIEAH